MTTAAATVPALTATCRATLHALKSGPVRLREVAREVRVELRTRGLIAEHTGGQLELTPRGRGVDAATFEAKGDNVP